MYVRHKSGWFAWKQPDSILQLVREGNHGAGSPMANAEIPWRSLPLPSTGMAGEAQGNLQGTADALATETTCGKCGQRLNLQRNAVGESSAAGERQKTGFNAYQKRGTWRHRICPRRKAHQKKKARSQRSKLITYPDGRQRATGYQWTKRVRELKARAEGWCEADAVIPRHTVHFIGDYGDPHHIVKRSERRDDRLENLLWICRAAHNEIHGVKS